MNAIRVRDFGKPEVMKIEEVPTPKPGTGEVLVHIQAVGVNPVDTYIRAGAYATKPKLPYTPGFDGSGTVESVGKAVKEIKTGSRVYCAGSISGTYAEYALCQSHQVHPIPDHISFSQGAGVYVPYATAYRALVQKAQAKAGETVLVHGASGGVGIAAVQIARALGLRIIGTASTEPGRNLAREAGAHITPDHSKTGYLKEIMEFTEDKGVNIVLEMLANINLNNDLTILAQEGRVVVIGSRGKIEIDPRLTMRVDGNILGLSLMNVQLNDLRSIHKALVAGLDDKTLKPVIGKEFSLADAPEAHKVVMRPGSYGKIVLIP